MRDAVCKSALRVMPLAAACGHLQLMLFPSEIYFDTLKKMRGRIMEEGINSFFVNTA
jgi:hypothetical protein